MKSRTFQIILLITCAVLGLFGQTPKTADEFVERGTEKVQEADFAAAIEDFNNAIKLKPDFAPAYHLRAFAYAGVGDLERALADAAKVKEIDYELSLSTDSVIYKPYFGRGKSLLNGEKYDEAIALFTKLVEKKPEFLEAYLERGSAKFKKGNADGAIADYTRAFDESSKYGAVILVGSVALYRRGGVHKSRRDFDRAIADYQKALEIQAKSRIIDSSSIIEALGDVRVEKGDFDGAIADYSKLIEKNPKNAGVLKKRGLAYVRAGRNEEGKEDLKKAIALDNRMKEEIEKELFLVEEASARTKTKISASSNIIRKINGTWAGIVKQAGVEDYSIVITFSGENSSSIYYPSYKCGGEIKFLETKAEKLIFSEILTQGTEKCEPGGRIEIELDDQNNLKWVWLNSDNQIVATAKLTKK